MLNTLSIETEIIGGDERFWVVIDGERRFQLGSECFEDSFFSPDGTSDPAIDCYRRSPSERIVDYGFCIEYCCPSTFATVRANERTVTWTNLRYSNSAANLGPEQFEFDRNQYQTEINRALLALVGHYQRTWMQLKCPPAPPAATTGADEADLLRGV